MIPLPPRHPVGLFEGLPMETINEEASSAFFWLSPGEPVQPWNTERGSTQPLRNTDMASNKLFLGSLHLKKKSF